MKVNTFAFRSSTEVKLPRFSTFRATMLNQISTCIAPCNTESGPGLYN